MLSAEKSFERILFMKKIIATLLCAAFISITAAGCGQDALYANSSSTSSTEETKQDATTAEELTDKNFSDNLDGLHDYFVAKSYIGESVTATDMDAKLVGASQGKKYKVSNEVTIELYEYDVKSIASADEASTANKILSSVKETGEFTILNLSPVKAYVSDSGKYLMVYSDTRINDEEPDTKADAYVTREKAIEDFKAFKK